MKRTQRGFRISLTGLVAMIGLAMVGVVVLPALAQQAKLTVDKDCIAFAFSPHGNRIVYAVRKVSEERVTRDKRMMVEHDDIWQVTMDGQEHRLVNGKKLVKGPIRVGYKIQSIRIAPDDKHMTVQMLTRSLVPSRQNRQGRIISGELTDLMNGQGKEINIYGTKPKNSAIFGAIDAAWLADGETVVYLTQPKDSLLYQLAFVRPASGRGGTMLPHHYYSAVAWSPAHNAAAAIERNKDLKGASHLVWIDLPRQSERTLATIKSFSGHLTVSPSGKEIAYFSGGNTITIRSVADPDKATHVTAPFGRYEWSADGKHMLLKPGPTNQSNRLILINLESGQHRNVLYSWVFQDFHVSPDGKWVGITEPGKHVLKLLAMP